jgi:hypothetical protein
MKYSSLIAFVFGILLSGCINTVGRIELKGRVVDDSTQTPIPNISVMVQAIQQRDDITKNIFIGDFTTDSSGCFTYTLNKIRDISLYNFCIEGNPDYDPSDQIMGLSDLHSYGKFLTIRIKRVADFTIKISRISKTTFRDTLTLTWETNGVDGQTFYPYKIENYRINSETGLKWIGGDVKSAIKTKVYADKNTIVHWELIRNGKHTNIIDTVFCKRDVANNVTFTY